MGNPQMFFNDNPAKMYSHQTTNPNHNLFDYSRGVNGSLIMLISLFFFIFQKMMTKILQKLTFLFRISRLPENFNIDWDYTEALNENLGMYWECLSGLEQKRWYAKEIHIQKNLNIQMLNDENLRRLKYGNRGKKCIMNICNFDILSNPKLAEAMFFQQMDRRKENASSDFVARALYLGYDKKHAEGQDAGFMDDLKLRIV